MSERVTRTVRMSKELAAHIDEARGNVPFEPWARGVFERALEDPALRARYRGGYGPNVENIRSSDQVKRNIGPIPKGGKK